MAIPKLTPTDFAAQKATLEKALTEGLEKELKDCAWEAPSNSDLWDLPTVDSKTVCKLSPIFESMTGHKLKAPWVRKGGYDSVPEAIADVMAKFEEHCVAPAAVSAAA
jgi:hypothetical protein